MTFPEQVSRREFLKTTSGSVAALVLAFHLPVRGEDHAQIFKPNAWLRITSDDEITVLVEKPELGQGSRTYTTMMVAEELEVDCSAIHVEQAPTIPAIYAGLRTGGSGGVQNTFTPMRQAGAQAREMLIMAAAQQWGARKSDCRAENGSIVHTPTGRRVRYGKLVEAASRLPVINLDEVSLKHPKDFRVIGTPIPRTDVPSKVDGSAQFGIDVRVPGMLFAVIARSPTFGGKLKRFNDTAARAVAGVRAIFPVPPLPRHYNTAGGVAVVAESTWAAIKTRKALALEWDEGSAADESSEVLHHIVMKQAVGPPTFIAVDRGDASGVLAGGVKKLESSYESPFQAHATMEPMNTTVHVRDGEIEVWSPTQFADEVQSEIAALSGLPSDKVIVHMALSGGSFGRRYQWDYAAEAWQVAKEAKQPVQLVRTREDDMQHDFYRPYNYQRLRAGLDDEGKVVAWSTRVVTTPIAASNLYTGYAESPQTLKDPATVAALEWYGADITPYAIPNFRIDYSPAESVVPRSWWRSVASSYTPFAKECFMDELADASGRDPLQFRRELLTDKSPETVRLRRVLELAAESSGWGKPLPKKHGRGIACRLGGSYNAQVAEVYVDDDGTVQVLRMVSAVDCGIAVNPDGVRAMTEGGINFALTAVLSGEITVKSGAVEQSNFHDYQVLRIGQAPEIEVHLVPSTEDPSGVGELGAMLVAPAVVNAVFDATGVRIRRLPIDSELLKRRT
ncbi:MAG TPA: xanthine dehydrogenase family protein molybdopterin-binding subunit [Terriglobales bacterium]|nr:xanthine dehydrogenase family protein molybdopterin-binding subunit [Terriglobales bacterium]